MGPSASVHETSVRVRYGEVDRMGVVYHGHYLAWFDQGRTEFFRSLGSSYRDLEDSGTLLVVVETSGTLTRMVVETTVDHLAIEEEKTQAEMQKKQAETLAAQYMEKGAALEAKGELAKALEFFKKVVALGETSKKTAAEASIRELEPRVGGG